MTKSRSSSDKVMVQLMQWSGVKSGKEVVEEEVAEEEEEKEKRTAIGLLT